VGYTSRNASSRWPGPAPASNTIRGTAFSWLISRAKRRKYIWVAGHRTRANARARMVVSNPNSRLTRRGVLISSSFDRKIAGQVGCRTAKWHAWACIRSTSTHNVAIRQSRSYLLAKRAAPHQKASLRQWRQRPVQRRSQTMPNARGDRSLQRPAPLLQVA
jgi:hypothetical protein